MALQQATDAPKDVLGVTEVKGRERRRRYPWVYWRVHLPPDSVLAALSRTRFNSWNTE